MKKSEIVVGGIYYAKVSDKITTVRVDAIREVDKPKYIMGMRRDQTVTLYDVTNLATKRQTTFRSAAKFRGIAHPNSGQAGALSAKAYRSGNLQSAIVEGKKCSDPTKHESEITSVVSPLAPVHMVPMNHASEPVIVDVSNAAKPISNGNGAIRSVGLAEKLKESKIRQDEGGPPHTIVVARAGTGKTTTLIEGMADLRGLPTTIQPSQQQEAVWEAMRLSKDATSIGFTCFNKSIADVLQAKLSQCGLDRRGCVAMTMHSMGFRSVIKQFGRCEPNSYVVQDLISEVLEIDIRLLRREKPIVLKATEKLVSLCKMNLVGYNSTPLDADALDSLSRHYDVDLTDGDRWGRNQGRKVTDYSEEVFSLVPQILERCKTPRGKIGFDDMIWLPVVLGLPVYQYDLLLVDEAQDLNRCQQELAMRAGKRLILVGDPKQAIYGFAGADSESMPRMQARLEATTRGCQVLPLTVTRRCGRAIVTEAQKMVSDFEAHEGNGEGVVSSARYPIQGGRTNQRGEARERVELSWEQTYCARVEVGDMLLCRVNAPLVKECFRFIKRGIKANIQGRDIGAGLIALIQKLSGANVSELVGRIDDWLAQEEGKEQAKRNPNEARLIALQDRADCLYCFCEGMITVDQVISRIQSVFTDDKEAAGVRLSSIHKAKGLEARTVFLLEPEGATVPHPMARGAWQQEQEWNCRYVAITRAIEELCYVS